ncbi:MAG: hypothetical protein ACOH1M_07000 [Rhodoglobus sp.]
MIFFTSLAHSAILWTATPTPEPTVFPEFDGDVNLVTPGVIGFVATLFIAVATLLIVMDMNRRVRRVRYRELAQETIRNEQALADGTTGDTAANADSATSADDSAQNGADTGTDTSGDIDGETDLPSTQRAD